MSYLYLQCVQCFAVLILILTNQFMKWKSFPHYWPFVRGIVGSPVISPHRGQQHGRFFISAFLFCPIKLLAGRNGYNGLSHLTGILPRVLYWCLTIYVFVKFKPRVHDAVMLWKLFPHYWPFVRETTGLPSQRASNAGPLIFYVLWPNKLCSLDSHWQQLHWNSILDSVCWAVLVTASLVIPMWKSK